MSYILFIIACISFFLFAEGRLEYSPVGKRDPFKVPSFERINRNLSSVNKDHRYAYSVKEFHLKAILKGGGSANAMFENPEGKTFILRVGDTIGKEKAKISRILSSDVVLTEITVDYLGKKRLHERVMSLSEEKR